MRENEKEYEKVINHILADIKDNKLTVGDRISTERELAKELGTSRNSIREAIRMLENMGVVESRQGSGNYVVGNMVSSFSTMLDIMLNLQLFSKNELFRFRMAMDKVICATLLEKPDRLEKLANQVDAIMDMPTHNIKEEEEQDRLFHRTLMEATENRLLIFLLRSATPIFANMIASVRQAADEEMREKLLQAHKNIANALRSGSRDKCDHAIEKHYKIVDEIVKKSKLEEYLENRVYEIDNIDLAQEKDAMTGLYNKNVFFEKVEEYVQEHPEEELMLWAVDIQGLRYINEKYGMEMGDQIIQLVAKRGKEREDYIFGGRIGGDKFCTLVHDCHYDFSEVNKSLVEEYDEKLPIPNISVKNGIYHIKKNDALSAHAMYVRAVLALQSIKNSYSTMIVEYNDSMRQELLGSRQIEADAKDSLKRGEFKVYLQPKINLAENKVAGAEALVRWIHGELGFLSPGRFIPIFEKNGFIKKLDYWIWEEVCKYLCEWKEKGLPLLPVSVNVSRNSFEDENLADRIIQLVDSYKLDHSLFEIEITEYSCLENMEKVQNTIKRLHDAGFIIALDDFGTGYSSMVVLSKFDIDIMKLDMSLIRSDDEDSKRSALEFALQLAEMMQLKTVAEGIETAEQVERIRFLGGDFIQGYFYSKPLPREEFEAFVHNYSCIRE